MYKIHGLKLRLEPTVQQYELLAQVAGSVRFVYNRALTLEKNYYKYSSEYVGYNELATILKSWRRAFAFLQAAPIHPLQQALRRLDRAYQDFFNREKGPPKFKRKYQDDSIHFPAPDQIQWQLAPQDARGSNRLPQIRLPKMGWFKFRLSKHFNVNSVRSVTVKRHGVHWFLALVLEESVPNPSPAPNKAVGIDLGVKRLATLSDGTYYAAIEAYHKYQEKLARLQQQLARKVKYSNNFHKVRFKIRKVYEKIKNLRMDTAHKVTTEITNNYNEIYLEDLSIKHMTASAKGSIESPGSKVAQKSGLNRRILGQIWGTIRLLLEYKAGWKGGLVTVVDAAYSSQECSVCGHTEKANRVSQAEFSCCHCGYTENADFNAAQNILARGLHRTVGHTGIACDDETDWVLNFIRSDLQEGIPVL